MLLFNVELMPGDNFNHVADVSCHPILKIHVIVECAANRLFAGAAALKFVDAQRFQQTEREAFLKVIREL